MSPQTAILLCQVITCWQAALGSQTGTQLLQRYGADGLMLAGTVLLGKLSRYSYYSQQQLRVEAARLSALLLQALFSGSLVHPQRRLGFALYVPMELWQGADLFEDPYRWGLGLGRLGFPICWLGLSWLLRKPHEREAKMQSANAP